jgi:hypothetical protein
MTKNVFYAMFAFQWGSLQVSKDVSYVEDNIILSFVYQVHDVNSKGMFWTITNGRYQIINKHAFNNYQDFFLTLGMATSMANIFVKGVVMKEEPNLVSHDSKFFVWMVESSFVDLCASFNEDDPSLLDVVVLLYMNYRHIEE